MNDQYSNYSWNIPFKGILKLCLQILPFIRHHFLVLEVSWENIVIKVGFRKVSKNRVITSIKIVRYKSSLKPVMPWKHFLQLSNENTEWERRDDPIHLKFETLTARTCQDNAGVLFKCKHLCLWTLCTRPLLKYNQVTKRKFPCQSVFLPLQQEIHLLEKKDLLWLHYSLELKLWLCQSFRWWDLHE